MKGKSLLVVLLVTSWQTAYAEPVFMPQAGSVVKARQMEAGAGVHYGYQSSEIIGSPGTTFINRVWQYPVLFRYGATDDVETRLIVPIVHAIDSSEGLASTRNVGSGLGNVQIGAKWNFLKGQVPLAAALDLDLPTANTVNNPAALGQRYSNQLQQGFNTHLQLIPDSPVFGDFLTGHAHVGYMNTATYTTSSRTRFNPSDLMTFGASLDVSLKRWVENLSVSAEAVGYAALNHSKTHSTRNGNDVGTVLEAGPAVRYQIGSVRMYAGYLADAGKSTFRAYNYRIASGVSVLFGGR